MSKSNGDQVVSLARDWLGTPYLHQQSHKQVGCDCLGLVRGIWRDFVGPEPEKAPNYSSDWGEVDQREPLLKIASRYFEAVNIDHSETGLLLLFRWQPGSIVKHLGIMSDPRHFIHAYEKAGVVESPLAGLWHQRLTHKFRFPVR